MEHDEIQQILDNFTLKQLKSKFLSKKEIIFQFGERTDDGDGIRYSWPEAIYVKILKRHTEASRVIVFGGQIISLKLRYDRVSFSTPSELIPKQLPDFLSEMMDRYESGIPLTYFDEIDIHRIK